MLDDDDAGTPWITDPVELANFKRDLEWAMEQDLKDIMWKGTSVDLAEFTKSRTTNQVASGIRPVPPEFFQKEVRWEQPPLFPEPA